MINAILFAVLFLVSACCADTITIGSATTTSSLTSPSLKGPLDSAFTYYGFPKTNYGTSFVYGYGISSTNELKKFPPSQFVFDLTGTNCEFLLSSFDPQSSQSQSTASFRINDGTQITPYTNAFAGAGGTRYILVTFSSNITHHLWVDFSGGFGGVNLTAGNTITSNGLSKPNLLIVQGDSYTEGYNPSITFPPPNNGASFWYDGWVYQTAHLKANTVPVPSGVGGTGFVSPTVPNYQARVVSDICALYTNAVNSGLYSNIFISASGTINDLGLDTNSIYTAATNVYKLIKDACPTAYVFCVGNWLGAGGRTAPDANDYAGDRVLSNASLTIGIPYFSAIGAMLRTTNNYQVYFPPGHTDSIHPSADGYAIMANWVNTNLAFTFGGAWTNNQDLIPPSSSYPYRGISFFRNGGGL